MLEEVNDKTQDSNYFHSDILCKTPVYVDNVDVMWNKVGRCLKINSFCKVLVTETKPTVFVQIVIEYSTRRIGGGGWIGWKRKGL